MSTKPLPFERLLTTHTEEEVFILHLQQKTDLSKMSEALQARFIRLQQCRNYIHLYRSRQKVVPMMMSDFGISEPQAYRDFTATVKIFNAAMDNDGRDFYADITIGDIAETRALARKKGDVKVMAQCDKNNILALKELYGNSLAKIYDEIQPPVLITKYIPNPNLPDNWREQAQKIISGKKKKFLDAAEDAEIIPDDESGEE